MKATSGPRSRSLLCLQVFLARRQDKAIKGRRGPCQPSHKKWRQGYSCVPEKPRLRQSIGSFLQIATRKRSRQKCCSISKKPVTVLLTPSSAGVCSKSAQKSKGSFHEGADERVVVSHRGREGTACDGPELPEKRNRVEISQAQQRKAISELLFWEIPPNRSNWPLLGD